MQPAERVARSRHRLDHLIGRGGAMLSVEEVAQRGVRPQLHQRRALRRHVGPVLVDLHGRFAEERVGPERSFGDAGMVDARVHVNSGVGRREGAERRECGDARKEPAGPDQRVARRKIGVDARERAEPLRRAQLVLGSARHVGRRVAELCRLFEQQTILQDRSAGFESRPERPDTFDVERLTATAEAKRRIQVVETRLPGVARLPRLDDDQA